jgi:hypothetical protein
MLESTLKSWREWGLLEKPRLIQVFDCGQNHHTALIESGATRLVLKVFKHSFDRTIEAETWASDQAFSPTLQFAAGNIALYDYIDDQGFSLDKIPSLGNVLKSIHDSDALTRIDSLSSINRHFDLLHFCDAYLATASTYVYDWHRLLMPALLEFINDPTPPAFCHNDLVIQNCLFQHDSIKFIDWEFAQRNNPWFDLAAIIHYFELDSSQASEFLSNYQHGWNRKANDSIFYTSQIAVLWCDLLWNMHNRGNGYRLKHTDRFKQLADLASKINITLPS